MALDTSKIIHAPIGGGKYTVTSPLTKSDYGIMLVIENAELPTSYQVDFSNNEHSGTSITMIGGADGVEIPKQFIDTGKDVFAWLYWVGEDYGKTVYKFRIPNKCRPERTNEQPTPEEQSVIDQAIAALNDAVEQTAQDVINADASAQSASADADRAEEARTDAQNYATQAEQSATSAQTSASQASASATASAQSAEQSAINSADAQDSAEEAQASASASAQSATASANSASQASGYAQSASASAQSASGYASSAQTSAQTASTKASEASTSASTASAKATESAQSATNAQTYASQAESAKTASQTAQGLAESARDSAISAQESAEDARDEAQSIVDGISGKVEQIDQNTADIASLEEDIYKPYVVDSASGAIASFPDGANDIPLKSLIVNIDPVQDTSSGDPSPENICPISGWTGMTVNATGKNLFNKNSYLWYKGYFDNSEIVSNVGHVIVYIRCMPNTTYTVSRQRTVTNERFGVAWTKVVPSSHVAIYNNKTSARTGTVGDWMSLTITTGEDAKYLAVWAWWSSSVDPSDTFQIELSDTRTDYAPYQGQTIPINWQTEAGTVYGGKLDVLSGVLTVYPYYASYNGETLTGEWISDRDVYAVGTTPTIGAQVVNIGAEGTEIQLEPHEVKSLFGANNIFADTGDSAVEYRADTTLYIQRLTQPTEDDMVANSAIASGQFFMIGNSLYKSLTAIASGATITVGTNAQRVSLADALNLINT